MYGFQQYFKNSLHNLAQIDNIVQLYIQVYYTLNVAGFSGTVVDGLTPHSGYGFTTYDNDHDGWLYNCAIYATGAWWYDNIYTHKF